MNHVGNLLEEVEGLLFSLREANNNYRDNAEKIIFLEKVYQTFSEQVKTIVKVPYKFDKIIDFLLFLFKRVHGPDVSIVDEDILFFDIGFSYLDYEYETLDVNGVLKNYLNLRNASFDIIILEHIYLQWTVSYGKKTLTKELYKSTIISLISEDLIAYILEQVDDLDNILVSIIPIVLRYSVSDKLFFAIDLYKSIVRYYKALADVEIYTSHDREKYLTCIMVMFAIHQFDGHLVNCIIYMLELLENDIEFIESVFEKMNKNIKLIGENDNPEYPLYKNFINNNAIMIREIRQVLEVEA
jgi:hypothetical protein